MTLEEAAAHVGGKVLYRAPRVGFEAVTAEQRMNDAARLRPAEEGVITSVNGTYVFVRYGSQVTSTATAPEMLEFLAKESAR
jgi:hypothetical protein